MASNVVAVKLGEQLVEVGVGQSAAHGDEREDAQLVAGDAYQLEDRLAMGTRNRAGRRS
ncbi:MAG: hypothetical protein ACR2GH_04625 [Pseudonocardia sp.]